MSFIRPEVIALLRRSSEACTAGMVLLCGLWLIWLGGYLLTPLGTLIGALGVAWLILSLRRMRFAQTVDAPGVVEVDEGQIGYLGPELGGFVALPDLVELRLITLRGRRLWRLKQSDGQALLIPVDAAGADRLFDAFTSLPGMDSLALVDALTTKSATGSHALTVAGETKTIWRRPGKRLLAEK